MFYVYILRSIPFPDQTYIGFSANLKSRLVDHNSGKSKHTVKFKPWQLKNYFAFLDEKSARQFEQYLKTGSGRAFCHRHFK
ncbi:MAG: GIY-YIG nuclease family protein [Patescibacteria group bacterium]|jgi:predicted GIY-YIG superfamily endonuclease